MTFIANGKSCTVDVLWDTGASTSNISLSIAECLQLSSNGMSTFRGATGLGSGPIFYCDCKLDNLLIHNLKVIGFDDSDYSFQALIGMDIISRGILRIQTGHMLEFEYKD